MVDFIPTTFHIQNNLQDEEYTKFMEFYNQRQQQLQDWEQMSDQDKRNYACPHQIYILKPGEETNRGQGIKVLNSLNQIKQILCQKTFHKNGLPKTYIIQLYIHNPMLYYKRKFDIRCFMLITSFNGIQKGYWYEEGYIRTSSFIYNLKNFQNKMIHLTNDAVQQKSDEYGRFEQGNKVSYKEFNKYFTQIYPDKDFFKDILPQMKNIASESLKASYGGIDPQRKNFQFEILGLDYMIDEELRIYLIEVNTNPCLDTSCNLLARLIPNMLENAFRLCIDPLFPPPIQIKFQNLKKEIFPENLFENNKFSIIFDEQIQGVELQDYLQNYRVYNSKQFDFEDEIVESDFSDLD